MYAFDQVPLHDLKKVGVSVQFGGRSVIWPVTFQEPGNSERYVRYNSSIN
jgi:hypothetical protein